MEVLRMSLKLKTSYTQVLEKDTVIKKLHVGNSYTFPPNLNSTPNSYCEQLQQNWGYTTSDPFPPSLKPWKTLTA